MLKIECFPVGVLKANCYLIEDLETGKMALVDTGGTSVALTEAVEKNKDKIEYIMLTHGHFDHIKAVKRYKDVTGAKVVACKDEEPIILDPEMNLSAKYVRKGLDNFDVDIFLSDSELITLGQTEIKLIHTPGHTKGSCCYLADGNIFSGDTLFKGEIGRTDLATGNYGEMLNSLKKLSLLSGDYDVYPGHGEKTTLKFEIQNNRYFKV